jgi:hypothetical protein
MDEAAKLRAQRTRRRKRRILLRRFTLVVLVVGLVLWWQWPNIQRSTSTDSQQTNGTDSQSQQTAASVVDNCDGNTPDFDVLTPNNKPVDELGGCVASPPGNESPYFVYLDTLKGINIQVTEQLLPEEFATDTQNKLANLAENYNRTITAGDNTTVRLGSSSKGEQFLIFSKHDLLIIIKAAGTLNDEQWIAYIDSLKKS